MEFPKCKGCPYYSPDTECTASITERVLHQCEGESKVEGIILFSEEKELHRRVNRLEENDGILNQITHLRTPDDGEDFNAVFDYLEQNILTVITQWLELQERLHELREERL